MHASINPSLLAALAVLAEAADTLGDRPAATAARALAERYLRREWFLLLLGETSNGKSTWINTLLGDSVLPATIGATTGAVVEVRLEDRGEPLFEARIDGAWSVVGRERFRTLCQVGAERLRLAWPAARCTAPGAVTGLVILDAPGYDSCVEGHEETLRGALREADATVLLTNWTRGVTARDAAFVQTLHNVEPLYAAVNWIPPTAGERRVAQMSRDLEQAAGRPIPAFPLRAEREGFVRVWSPALWDAIRTAGTSPARAARVEQNVVAFAMALVDRLAEELETRASVVGATEEQVVAVRDALALVRESRRRAEGLVTAAEGDLARAVEQTCDRARDALWTDATRAIDDANRLLDAGACSAHIQEHVAPHALRGAADTLEAQLGRAADALGEALDALHAEAGELYLPEVRFATPAWEPVRDAAGREGVRRVAQTAFTQALNRLGGAAGPKAGFVNLAKMTVSRAGNLFGKTFSRGVYDAMGATLKRLRFTAGVATAAIGVIVTEAVAYLYRVVRWKQKLRTVLQYALALPVTDEPLEDALMRRLPFGDDKGPPPIEALRSDALAAVREALAETRTLVVDNFGRREELLARALADRAAGATTARARHDELAVRIGGIRSSLLTMEVLHG